MRYLIILLFSAMSWAQCYEQITVESDTWTFDSLRLSNATEEYRLDAQFQTTLNNSWPRYDSFRRVSGFGINVSVRFLEPHNPRWELNGGSLVIGDELIFPDGEIREINSVSTSIVGNDTRHTYALNQAWTGQFTSNDSCIRVRRAPTLTVNSPYTGTQTHPYRTDVQWGYTAENCDDCEVRRQFNNGSWQSHSGARVAVGDPMNINIGTNAIRPGATNTYRFALYRDGVRINETITERIPFRMVPEFRNVRIDGSSRSNRRVEFEPDAEVWVRYDAPVLLPGEFISGHLGIAAGFHSTDETDAANGLYKFTGVNYSLGNKNVRLGVYKSISSSITEVISEQPNLIGFTVTPEFTAVPTRRIVGPYDFKWPQLRRSGVAGGYLPWAANPNDAPSIKLADIVGRSWIAEVTFYDDDGRYGGGCNDRTTQIGWRLQYRNSSNAWITINEDGFDLTDRHIGRRSGNNDDGEHGGYIESDPSTEWQAGRDYRVRLQMRRGGQSHCSRTNEAYAGGSSQSTTSMYFRVVE